MKRKNKSSEPKPEVIRVWTFPQAQGALPYITSVMHSLREHWLDAQRHELRAKRLADRPGRPDRTALIGREVAVREEQLARDQFNEAYQELRDIEVFCIDPNQGMAVLPFVHAERLAWLLYDVYAPEAFHHWRYHDDPLETRRPIAEALPAEPSKDLIV